MFYCCLWIPLEGSAGTWVWCDVSSSNLQKELHRIEAWIRDFPLELIPKYHLHGSVFQNFSSSLQAPEPAGSAMPKFELEICVVAFQFLKSCPNWKPSLFLLIATLQNFRGLGQTTVLSAPQFIMVPKQTSYIHLLPRRQPVTPLYKDPLTELIYL